MRGRSIATRTASSTPLSPGARYCQIFNAEILIPEKHFLFYQPRILASVGLNCQPEKPSENYIQDVPGSHQDAIVTPLISPDSSVLYSFTSSFPHTQQNLVLCSHCQVSQPSTEQNCKHHSSRLRFISLFQELFIDWFVALSKFKRLGCQQSTGMWCPSCSAGGESLAQVTTALGWQHTNTTLELQGSPLPHIPPSLHAKPVLNLTCS